MYFVLIGGRSLSIVWRQSVSHRVCYGRFHCMGYSRFPFPPLPCYHYGFLCVYNTYYGDPVLNHKIKLPPIFSAIIL